jgi:hypothetical protein
MKKSAMHDALMRIARDSSSSSMGDRLPEGKRPRGLMLTILMQGDDEEAEAEGVAPNTTEEEDEEDEE